MKRWLKRLGICAGGLALLLLLFAMEEHVRGRWALNRQLSRLKAGGAEFLVAALEPPHPPPDQNMFVSLTNLAAGLESVVKHLDDAPPSLRFAAPGKEIVAWRLNQWGRNKNLTNDWSRLGPELENARELLDLLHTTAQKPAYDSGFDYKKGFVDFQIGSLARVKRPAQILQAATYYELHRGNLEAAGGRLCDLVKLAANQQPEPLMICQLVREASAFMAFDATWQILEAPGWKDAQLAAIQTAWEGCDFPKDMGTAMEMERALSIDFYEQIKSSQNKLALAMHQREADDELLGGILGSSFPTHGFVQRWAHLPFWRLAWADQEELFALSEWSLPIEREKLARANGWAALSSGTASAEAKMPWSFLGHQAEMGWYDRLRFPFASQGFSVNDNEMRRALCAQTQQQMAVTAIALQRYRLQMGPFPADLAALLPKYISALPPDDMDGKTLRYGLRPDGGFLLYSVGVDGKDDGGNPTLLSDKKKFNQIWDARDAVWPSPATDQEALAAMKSAKD